MTVVGISIVKDEADIIATTMRHMVTQVDHLLVYDNMSTDGTREILDGLADEFNDPIPLGRKLRMCVFTDAEPAYYQSRKMTALAHEAHEMFAADWIVPFDADEIWYSSFAPTLAERLTVLGPQWQVVQADLYDHVCTGLDDENEADPVKRITWRTADKIELPKVACRWRQDLVIDAGNHRALYDESGATISHDRFVVRHFPYRSVQQFVSKVRNGAAAYALTDLPDTTGAHWRGYGAILDAHGEDVLVTQVYARWFYEANPDRPNNRPLIQDPAPFRR